MNKNKKGKIMKKYIILAACSLLADKLFADVRDVANRMRGAGNVATVVMRLMPEGPRKTQGEAVVAFVEKGADTVDAAAKLVDHLSTYLARAQELAARLKCVDSPDASCKRAGADLTQKNKALVATLRGATELIQMLSDDIFGVFQRDARGKLVLESNQPVLDRSKPGVIVSLFEFINSAVAAANAFRPGIVGETGNKRLSEFKAKASNFPKQVLNISDFTSVLGFMLDPDAALANLERMPDSPQKTAAQAQIQDFKAEPAVTQAQLQQVSVPGEDEYAALLA
jgi:hypothetical protein